MAVHVDTDKTYNNFWSAKSRSTCTASHTYVRAPALNMSSTSIITPCFRFVHIITLAPDDTHRTRVRRARKYVAYSAGQAHHQNWQLRVAMEAPVLT
eukprot:4936028-Pleurochrysis_carterae.AAC.5